MAASANSKYLLLETLLTVSSAGHPLRKHDKLRCQ
jgi:hypothetical protein